jgi:heme oxygenase
MTDLLSRLKIETADCHHALERDMDIMRPTMSRSEYVALLTRFRAFVAPWESILRAALPDALHPFVDAREKTALLDADLAFLGAAPIAPSLAQAGAAQAAAVPLQGVGACFGSLYVMEGSTLGGRFIGPAMAQRFGLSDRQGYAYFDPYGDRTGSMWNAFKAEAVAQVPAAEYDAAVTAARATFDALQHWLPQPMPAA